MQKEYNQSQSLVTFWTNENKKLSYRRETARQLHVYLQAG